MNDDRYTHLVRRESGYIAGWFQGEPPAEFVAECNRNVPDDPAHVEALDWAAWDRWMDELEPRDAGHTCEQGPLCEQMDGFLTAMSGYDDDPMSHYYGFYPEPLVPQETECQHWTCLGIVHGRCDRCQHEAMAELYRDGA